MRALEPSYVFVDGNHKYPVALSDHRLADAVGASYIVHHDIVSQACDTRVLWPKLMKNEANASAHPFRSVEFVQQYRSVRGTFLGIGVLIRKHGASGHQHRDHIALRSHQKGPLDLMG